MADDSAQRNANLARIRDNQRRSRARRKEYLEELESKVRDNEAIGIEASSQIQSAARRVLDENKRLRQLLKQKGVPDAEVEAAVTGIPPGSGESLRRPTAADALDAMLGVKWSRREGQSQVFQMGPSSGHRDEVAPTPPSDSSSSHQATPSSFGSGSGMMHQQYFSTFAPQGTDHAPTPSSDSGSSHYTTPAYMGGGSGYQPQQYPFVMPAQAQHNWQSQDITMSAEGPQQMSNYDASSCLAVANAVRSMNPDMGQELEAEMGCEEGQDCNVPNSTAFDLIDRFSGT